MPAAVAPAPPGTAVRIVKYSDKSVAVFGSTLPIKDTLKASGGMYNARLQDGSGGQAPGWILSLTKHPALVTTLRGAGVTFVDHTPAAQASPAAATPAPSAVAAGASVEPSAASVADPAATVPGANSDGDCGHHQDGQTETLGPQGVADRDDEDFEARPTKRQRAEPEVEPEAEPALAAC